MIDYRFIKIYIEDNIYNDYNIFKDNLKRHELIQKIISLSLPGDRHVRFPSATVLPEQRIQKEVVLRRQFDDLHVHPRHLLFDLVDAPVRQSGLPKNIREHLPHRSKQKGAAGDEREQFSFLYGNQEASLGRRGAIGCNLKVPQY